MTEFVDTMTLKEARDALRLLVEEGARCPCCTQLAKVYKRKVHAGMARLLIAMWRNAGEEWLYLPSLPQKSRDGTGLAYWGLIEEEKARREDGGRAGWWRITEEGRGWVLMQTTIPKYAMIYDGRCLGHRGAHVTIRDALGTRFDYDDLMAGV
jgi:hypothetical protein